MYIFVFFVFLKAKSIHILKKKTLYQNTGSIPLLSGDFESPLGVNELYLGMNGERVGRACAPNCNGAQASDLSCLFVSAMQKCKRKKKGQKKHFTSFVSWRSYSIFSTHRQSFLFVPWSGKKDDHVVTVLCCGRVQTHLDVKYGVVNFIRKLLLNEDNA